MFDEVADKK